MNQKELRNLTYKDYKTIKDLAVDAFVAGGVDAKREDLFVAQCYTNALITYLNLNGYKIVKDEVKDEQQ